MTDNIETAVGSAAGSESESYAHGVFGPPAPPARRQQSPDEKLVSDLGKIKSEIQELLNGHSEGTLKVLTGHRDYPDLQDKEGDELTRAIYLLGLKKISEATKLLDESQSDFVAKCAANCSQSSSSDKSINSQLYEARDYYNRFIEEMAQRAKQRIERASNPPKPVPPYEIESLKEPHKKRNARRDEIFAHADTFNEICDTSLLKGPVDEERVLDILKKRAPELATAHLEVRSNPLYMRQLSQVAWAVERETYFPDRTLLKHIINDWINRGAAEPNHISEIVIKAIQARRNESMEYLGKVDKGFSQVMDDWARYAEQDGNHSPAFAASIASVIEDVGAARQASYSYWGAADSMHVTVQKKSHEIVKYWRAAYEDAIVAQTAAAMASTHEAILRNDSNAVIIPRINVMKHCGYFAKKALLANPIDQTRRNELFSSMAMACNENPDHKEIHTAIDLESTWDSTLNKWDELYQLDGKDISKTVRWDNAACHKEPPAGATLLANYIAALDSWSEHFDAAQRKVAKKSRHGQLIVVPEDNPTFVKMYHHTFSERYPEYPIEQTRLDIKDPEKKHTWRDMSQRVQNILMAPFDYASSKSSWASQIRDKEAQASQDANIRK